MPVIEILNPQDPIPEVKSVYTALKGVEVEVDLNEDSWARDYFIIFFHTGPNDPVSTSIPFSTVYLESTPGIGSCGFRISMTGMLTLPRLAC